MDEEKVVQEDEENAKAGKKKKKGKLLLIIMIVAAVLVCGSGAFILYAKTGGKTQPKVEAAAKEEDVMFTLDPFIVNLGDPNANKFLKATVDLELSGKTVMEKAKAMTPQIRDAIINTLTSQTYDSLMQPDGKPELKDDITMTANQILGNDAVKNVYFTEFVMQ